MATPLRKWTDADDRTLAALHGQGLSLHAISKEMRRAKDTISKHAAGAGLTFDRTVTAVATAAAREEAKSRQVRIEHDLLSDVELVRRRVTDVGSFRDMLAFGQGLDATVRAYANFKRTVPDDGGLDHARSVLGRILLAIEFSLSNDEGPLMNPIGVADPETGEIVLAHTFLEWWGLRQKQIAAEARERGVR